MRTQNQFDRSGLFDTADGRLPFREFECSHTTRRTLSLRAASCMYEFHRASNPIRRAASGREVRLIDCVGGIIHRLDQCGREYFRTVACSFFDFAEGAKLGSLNQRFDLLNDGSDQRDVFRCRESLRYGGRIVYSLQCSGANHRHAMQRELNHLPMVMVMRDHAPAKGVD